MESKCTTRQRENKAGRIYGWQLHWRKVSPRATFDIMKSRRNFTTRLVLIFALVCAISVTSGIAQGAPQGGRLIVDRAPNFGWNLAVHLKIDGRAVADIVQGRHFDGFLPAGRHVLTASAVPAGSGAGKSDALLFQNVPDLDNVRFFSETAPGGPAMLFSTLASAPPPVT